MKKFYIFLGFLFPASMILAQSPGGVSANLSLWLRADANTHSTDSLNAWDYFNNPSNSFSAVTGSRPIVVNSSLNFQPTVSFRGAQLMDGPVGAAAPITAGNDAYSIFGVWFSTVGSSPGVYQRVWSQRNTSSNNDGTALWLFNGASYGDQAEIPPYTQGAVQAYTANTWYMSQLNLLAANTNDLEIVDQTNLTGSPTVVSTDPGNNAISTRNLANAVNRLGANADAAIAANDGEFFSGNAAEVIVYNGPVSSGTTRNQIFSYLALKYGIHAGISLLSSAGTTIWDAATNSTYNHNVFGIGLDNGSSLNLTQSNSINTGSGNGTGQTGAVNLVLSNPSALSTDQSFLIIGTDSTSLAETTSNTPTTAAGSQRLGRSWKVQQTGNVGTVDLGVDLTGATISGTIGTTTDFRLIVDRDGDGDFTTGSGNQLIYSPSSFTGNVANFTSVTLANNVVIGVITKASATTPLPVTWVSFTAKASGSDADLNWTVAANDKGKVYEVEHSTDGIVFSTIGEVPNDAKVTSYSFVHTNAGSGLQYYRIKEVDLDGNFIYSKIVSVSFQASDFSLLVLNNPVVNNAEAGLLINAVSAGNATVELWTVSGARISTRVQSISAGTNRISIPLSGLPSVSYVAKVTLNNTTHTIRLIKL